MAEKNNITIYRKIIKSKIFFIFVVSIFLALAIGIIQKFYYRYEIQKELNKLNTELANVNKEKEGLNGLLDYYKDESNLEKEARIRLNLKKEGEKVVIILPMATSTVNGENASGASKNSSDIPNYKQWWYYFFNR